MNSESINQLLLVAITMGSNYSVLDKANKGQSRCPALLIHGNQSISKFRFSLLPLGVCGEVVGIEAVHDRCVGTGDGCTKVVCIDTVGIFRGHWGCLTKSLSRLRCLGRIAGRGVGVCSCWEALTKSLYCCR